MGLVQGRVDAGANGGGSYRAAGREAGGGDGYGKARRELSWKVLAVC